MLVLSCVNSLLVIGARYWRNLASIILWILLAVCFAADMPDSGKVAPDSGAASPSPTPEPEQLPEEGGESGETPERQGRNYNYLIYKCL